MQFRQRDPVNTGSFGDSLPNNSSQICEFIADISRRLAFIMRGIRFFSDFQQEVAQNAEVCPTRKRQRVT
jgi:phosphopantetheine adenylyltransferase